MNQSDIQKSAQALLGFLWEEIELQKPENWEAGRRALAAGAAPEDLLKLQQAAAYELVFSILSRGTDEWGINPDHPGKHGWALIPLLFGKDEEIKEMGSPEDLEGIHAELLINAPVSLNIYDVLDIPGDKKND